MLPHVALRWVTELTLQSNSALGYGLGMAWDGTAMDDRPTAMSATACAPDELAPTVGSQSTESTDHSCTLCVSPGQSIIV